MGDNEKRSDLRIALDCIICFLEVPSDMRSAQESASYQETICEITDISASGIRVDLDNALQKQAIHKIRIQMPAENRSFHLVGEVAWSNENGPDGPQAGILLLESDNTDFAEWKKQVALLMIDPEDN